MSSTFGFAQKQALTLPEELLLLSMRDDDGKIIDPIAATSLGYSLAGAVLMELALQGHITIHPDKTCTPLSGSVPGDALLDTSLQLLVQRKAKNKKPYQAKEWVMTFYAYTSPMKRLLESLVAKGMVRLETKKTLGIFTTKRYLLANTSLKRSLERRLWDALNGTATSDARTLALLALLKSSKIAHNALCNEHTGHRLEAVTFLALISTALERSRTPYPSQNLADDAEQLLQQERAGAMLDMASDIAWLTIDIIDSLSDAIDGFTGGEGGDGGSDGGSGGDGGGGGSD